MLACRNVCDFNFMLSDVEPQVTVLFMLVNCLKKLEVTLNSSCYILEKSNLQCVSESACMLSSAGLVVGSSFDNQHQGAF